MGAKSPLLWDEGQVDEYLAGSPLVAEIKERLKVWTQSFTGEFSRVLITNALGTDISAWHAGH